MEDQRAQVLKATNLRRDRTSNVGLGDSQEIEVLKFADRRRKGSADRNIHRLGVNIDLSYVDSTGRIDGNVNTPDTIIVTASNTGPVANVANRLATGTSPCVSVGKGMMRSNRFESSKYLTNGSFLGNDRIRISSKTSRRISSGGNSAYDRSESKKNLKHFRRKQGSRLEQFANLVVTGN